MAAPITVQVKPLPMGDKRFSEICAQVTASYKSACILFIDEIINADLQSKFEARRAALTELRGQPPSELQLFHGTKEHSVQAIINEGFRVDCNKTAAFGIGTYLSPVCAMASGYTDMDQDEVSHMFLCKVLIGNITTTVRSQETTDTTLYDCSVNQKTKPTIYSIPYDDAVLPMFHIAFYKNAK